MRARRLVTARGLAVLAAATVAFIAANALAAPVLSYVALLLVLLVMVGLLTIWLPDARGEVTRAISTDLLTVGEPSEVRMHLRVRGHLIRHARWTDALPPGVEGHAEGFVSPPGAPIDQRASIPLSYEVRGLVRGVWALGPLTLCTGDPFGLVQRHQRVGTTRTITVVPQVVPLPALAAQCGTAHRGTLMVRQEEDEASPDALVILDLDPARWSGRAHAIDPRFEAAVSACASAAVHLAEAGYAVDAQDGTGTLLGTLRGQEEDRDLLLVRLATVAPHGTHGAPHWEGTPQGPSSSSPDASKTTPVSCRGIRPPPQPSCWRPIRSPVRWRPSGPAGGARTASTREVRMPETARPHPSPLGASPAVASALTILGLAVAVWPYTAVIEPATWLWPVGVVALAVVALGALLRAVPVPRHPTARAALTTGAQVVLGGLLVAGLLLPQTALFGFLPTAETARAAATHFVRAAEAVWFGSAPLPAEAPLVLTLACTVMVILLDTFLAHDRSVLALLTVAAIGTAPTVITRFDVDLVWFLAFAGFALIVLRRSAGRDEKAPRRAPVGVALGVGAVAVAATLVVAPGIPLSASGFGSAAQVTLNPTLDLGDDLRQPQAFDVVTLATDAGRAPYLRIATLSDFDGEVWAVDDLPTQPLSDGFGPLPLPDGMKTQSTSIRVQDVTGSWLPLPYPAIGVSGLDDEWRAMPGNRSIVSEQVSPADQDYTISTVIVAPSQEQMRADRARGGDPVHTALPADVPGSVAVLAREVTAGAESDYDRLIALQSWFRTQFAYSLDAPVEEGFDGSGAEAVGRFLEVRAGYCVHFAGAFALMARSLEMPTRIVVGFLPGSPTGEMRDEETCTRCAATTCTPGPRCTSRSGAGSVSNRRPHSAPRPASPRPPPSRRPTSTSTRTPPRRRRTRWTRRRATSTGPAKTTGARWRLPSPSPSTRRPSSGCSPPSRACCSSPGWSGSSVARCAGPGRAPATRARTGSGARRPAHPCVGCRKPARSRHPTLRGAQRGSFGHADPRRGDRAGELRPTCRRRPGVAPVSAHTPAPGTAPGASLGDPAPARRLRPAGPSRRPLRPALAPARRIRPPGTPRPPRRLTPVVHNSGTVTPPSCTASDRHANSAR